MRKLLALSLALVVLVGCSGIIEKPRVYAGTEPSTIVTPVPEWKVP